MHPYLHMGGHLNVCLPFVDPAWMAIIVDTDTNRRLLSSGLTDGGTAGLIWGFIGVSIGFTLVYASIAEMASM